MSTSTPIRCAVLGFGMSAVVFHIPFILALPELFQLVSIYERKATPEKSEARDAHPDVKVVSTLQQVLEDDLVDLVFVSTINDTHYDFAKACLLAGKHCVVEKPLTPTSAQAYELAELAQEKKLVLAVYQNRRYDSDFLTIRKLIQEEKAFGDISEFESHFDRFKNVAATTKLWKEQALPGSGAAYDLGSHLVDQILALFGKPEKVTAILRNSRLIGNSEVPDSFTIHLHYGATDIPGRRLPLIATACGGILSLLSPQTRFIIKGTSASFLKSGIDVQEIQLKEGAAKAVSTANFGVEPASLEGTLYTETGSRKIPTAPGRYIDWFRNVAEAVQTKDPSLLAITPEQAALTIRIIEAAHESSDTGRTVLL